MSYFHKRWVGITNKDKIDMQENVYYQESYFNLQNIFTVPFTN